MSRWITRWSGKEYHDPNPREGEGPSVVRLHGGHALPFEAAVLFHVVNPFTSFGYFSSDDENCVVLTEVNTASGHGATGARTIGFVCPS